MRYAIINAQIFRLGIGQTASDKKSRTIPTVIYVSFTLIKPTQITFSKLIKFSEALHTFTVDASKHVLMCESEDMDLIAMGRRDS